MESQTFPDLDQFMSLNWIRRLPDWISVSFHSGILVVVAAGPNGEHFHCDCRIGDETEAPGDEIEPRIVVPMLNNLLGAIVFAEFGEDVTASFRWEIQSAMQGLVLSEHQQAVIARRKAMTAQALGFAR
jgi:hypothetical protein